MTRRCLGNIQQKVDSAGRISVPTPYRKMFDLGGVVARDMFEKCLILRTNEDWDLVHKRYYDDVPPHVQKGMRARRFMAKSQDFDNLDGHGRFLVPAYLRQYAGIESDVILVGMGNYFEIWAPEEYERYWEADAQGELLHEDAAELA